MRKRLLGIAAAALAAFSGCHRRPPSREGAALARRMEAHVYRDSALAYPVPYRLYVPPTAGASSQRYPLLVYLHGAGGRGSDNISQLSSDVDRFLSLEVQSLGPFFVLAPQCPDNDEWINRHASPPFRTYDQSKFAESDAAKATGAIVAQLLQTRIDPERVYITGPSMGGSGTWDFITRHPGIVAAAIPVTGVGDPSRASVIADLPIWAFHGTLDDISPVDNARAMRRALEAVGGKAQLTEFPGVGHDSWTKAYGQRETFVWLLSQKRDKK